MDEKSKNSSNGLWLAFGFIVIQLDNNMLGEDMEKARVTVKMHYQRTFVKKKAAQKEKLWKLKHDKVHETGTPCNPAYFHKFNQAPFT